MAVNVDQKWVLLYGPKKEQNATQLGRKRKNNSLGQNSFGWLHFTLNNYSGNIKNKQKKFDYKYFFQFRFSAKWKL